MSLHFPLRVKAVMIDLDGTLLDTIPDLAVAANLMLPSPPRNAFGLAKDLPGPEMEALLRRHVPVNDETMRELALQRGLAVRDALIAAGLPSERLFLAAPKLHEPGPDEAGWTPQAQLSLSVK